MNNSPILVPISLGMVKTFLVVGERPILIDAGTRGSAPRIVAALAEQGFSPEDLALILITHAHVDHIGGLAEMRALTSAPIAVHRGDAEAVRGGSGAEARTTGWVGRLVSLLPMPSTSQGVAPEVVFDGDLDLAPYGVDGRAIHTPGHSPGSVCVVLSGGEAIVGDLIMGGFIRQGRPRLPIVAADMAQVEVQIRALLQLDIHTIYPSHGGPFTLDAVRGAFS